MSLPTVLGVGIDLVDVERLSQVRARRDIMRLVCAPDERPAAKTDLGAARLWAGKEAVAKALSTGLWQQGIDWPDIVINGTQVELRGKAEPYYRAASISLDFTLNGKILMAVAMRWGYLSEDKKKYRGSGD